MANKSDLRMRETVEVETGDIGLWTRLVGGSSALFTSMALFFFFPNGPLFITLHSGYVKNSQCQPISYRLFPRGMWNVTDLDSLLKLIFKSLVLLQTEHLPVDSSLYQSLIVDCLSMKETS